MTSAVTAGEGLGDLTDTAKMALGGYTEAIDTFSSSTIPGNRVVAFRARAKRLPADSGLAKACSAWTNPHQATLRLSLVQQDRSQDVVVSV